MTGPGAHDRGAPDHGTLAEEVGRLAEVAEGWLRGWLAAGSEVRMGDAESCRLCPICAVIGSVRRLRPDVAEHLLDAAGSFAAAVRAAVDGGGPATAPTVPASAPVEHIDVS